MAKNFKSVLLLLLFSLLMPVIAQADTIRGEFKFNKKVPFVGLIYFADDNSGLRSAGRGSLVIDQINKEFTKKMVVGSMGSEIIFKNSDPFDHNIYSRDIQAGVDFDTGMVASGDESRMKMDWKSGKIIRIGCKIHPKMRAYIANIPSSFYKIMDFSDRRLTFDFELKDVPSAFTKVRIWIPRSDLIELDLRKGDSKSFGLTRRNKKYGELSMTRE